jgi:hypothetical protein
MCPSPQRLLVNALLLSAALAASMAKPGDSRAAPVRRVVRGAPGAARLLPDSVLLRIDGREDVTARRFARAVRLLGGNPDSLTPPQRDEFLELVTEQRLLARLALADPTPWEAADSLRFMGECDAILMRAALAGQFTRIEARRRASGQPDLDEQAMGVAARDSLMAELRPTFDAGLLKRVGGYFAQLPRASAEMSPLEQIRVNSAVPTIPASDTLRVLARSSLGEFTVADLLADWRRLARVYRPHVQDDEGVRALVENSLFERIIRNDAMQPALAQRPEVAAVIADRAEFHGMSQYLRRTLLDSIPTDSLTLQRYHGAHARDFERSARAILVLLTFDDKRSADSLARIFTVPGEAESLAFRAQRAGVNYTHVASARGDSALYAQAMRTGVAGVAGPDRVPGGWRVYKVLALERAQPQPYATVRQQVLGAWYEFESERRIRALLGSLKRRARLVRNEQALRAIVLPRPSSNR